MGRSSVNHFGLLNRWPDVMHEDRWRFNQIRNGGGVRISPGCPDMTYIQYERDYIAQALAESATKAAEYLGFYPAPRWIVDEEIVLDSDLYWGHQILETQWGHIQSFGKRATTTITQNAQVVYADEDSDETQETARVTVTTTVADSELQVFFRVTDGADGAAHEHWRIEPLTVIDNGDGTKTLKGHRALFVNPKTVWSQEYEQATTTAKFTGSTDEDSDFVTHVDVYRVYADASSAVQALSNPGLTGDEGALTNVSAWIRDARAGRFQLYATSGQTSPSAPEVVRVSYLAGYPLDSGQMNGVFATPLIRYANTRMPQEPGFCDRAQKMWNEDREPPRFVSEADAENPPPFGLTNGGLNLWATVNDLRIPGKGKREESRASGKA